MPGQVLKMSILMIVDLIYEWNLLVMTSLNKYTQVLLFKLVDLNIVTG